MVSAIGMADNLRADFDGGSYHWTEGRNTLQEETIRIVPETFVVLDFDFVVLMMLVGSIGVAAAALWGAFRWESAKIEESQQEGIRGLLDELPPEVLRAGANYRKSWSAIMVPRPPPGQDNRAAVNLAANRGLHPSAARSNPPATGSAAPGAGRTSTRTRASATPAAREADGVRQRNSFGRWETLIPPLPIRKSANPRIQSCHGDVICPCR